MSRRMIPAAVITCIMIITGCGAVLGSYALTLRVAQETRQQILHSRVIALRREQAAAARARVPECATLRAMASASGTHPPGVTYGRNLEAVIRRVYAASGCQVILAGQGGDR